MKKSLLLSTLLIIFLAFQSLGQAVVPNGSFEEWDDMSTYMDPTLWDSPNPETSLVGITPVTREETDVYDGVYAARLETKQVITFVAPGLLTLGEFSVDFITTEFIIDGGQPFTDMPLQFSGYYKYAPVDDDTWFITTMFTKWNDETNQRDTIGGSTFDGSGTVEEWTQFTSDIIWWGGTTPDTVNIIVLSSDFVSPVVGSVLLLDKFEFHYEVGMDESTLENDVRMHNDLLNKQLTLTYNFDEPQNVEVRIYNMMGQQVKVLPSISVMNSTQNINLNDLEKGLYLVEVNNGKEKITRKIML